MQINKFDPEIAELIEAEGKRQKECVNLIASENYTHPAVREVTGSILTNKYAEGYPGKRYYAGCQFIDQIEQIAIDRCMQLFGAEHANVQPHSGSQANMAAYLAILKPGDTIMGMSLAEGGHLTHGHPVNFSGQLYNFVPYGVDRNNEQLNYNLIKDIAQQHKPKMIVAGASAYSRIIDFERFAEIAQSVGALLMVDMAHIAGLVAAGKHPSPVAYADIVTSTTHKTLRGPRGGFILCKKEYASQIDKAIMPGMQGGPLMNTIGAKAVCFKQALEPTFTTYQQQVIENAHFMAQEFIKRGYRIVSGGTENHLFIIDLSNKNITGKQAEIALANAGIYLNRNCIPYDSAKPWITSGIRIGTPAITTRGMKNREALMIVDMIDTVLKNYENENVITQVRTRVDQLCAPFPLFEQ